jgi:hypothetical protein
VTHLEREIADAWLAASRDLGVQVTTPAPREICGSSGLFAPALVQYFGKNRGAVVLVLGEPSETLAPTLHEYYFVSIVAAHYRQYRRDLFMETLNDWGYFGPRDLLPPWYTGAVVV